MNILTITSISAVISSTYAYWITDVNSTKDLKLENPILLHVDHTHENSSLLEKASFAIYNKGVGIVEKLKKDTMEWDSDLEGKFEGRDKKTDDMLGPLIIGGVGTGTISMVVAAMKMIVVKALFVSKIALLLTIILLIGQLMEKKHTSSPQIEVEHYEGSQSYPIYTEYSSDGGGNAYGESSNGGMYGDLYHNAPSAMAESVLNYATVEVPEINNTLSEINGPQHITAARRRGYSKHKSRSPMTLTIRHYTKPSTGII